MSRSPRRSITTITAFAAMGMLVMSGCAQTVVAVPGDDATQVDGGTIVYGHQQEPPCVFGGWIEQAYLSYQVLDSLVSLDADGTIVPWLAEEWEVASDQLSWTFTLAEDVTFTDGSALTAEVVAYNFDHWLAGGNDTARVWLEGYYDRAEVIDDRTVRIHLLQPYPLFAQNLTQGYFGIQSQVALETRTDEENCEQPIGSGAFIVEEWNRGENILLVRNDDYTSPPANARHDGPAFVERVDWRFVGDPTTRVSALKAGEVDAIYDVPAIEWAGLDQGPYELHRYVTPGRPQQITFNTAKGIFVDERVRAAFVHSLDREAIVETIGRGVIPYEGNGGVSSTTPGYSQTAAERFDFDLDEADRLLDAAGWVDRDADGYRVKDGVRLEARFPYAAGRIINADGAAILQGVQEQAKAAGFKVDLIPIPSSAAASAQYTGVDGYDISVGYWTAVNAGILHINWRQDLAESPNPSNQAFYNDPELEALIVAANSTVDEDARNDLYGQAQEYIADRALAVGIYARLSTLAVHPALRDVWQEHSQGGPVFHDAYFVE